MVTRHVGEDGRREQAALVHIVHHLALIAVELVYHNSDNRSTLLGTIIGDLLYGIICKVANVLHLEAWWDLEGADVRCRCRFNSLLSPLSYFFISLLTLWALTSLF